MKACVVIAHRPNRVTTLASRAVVRTPSRHRPARRTVLLVTDVSDASRLHRAVGAHLGSRDVARVIYGAIIGLALVVALGQHPPTSGQAVGAIIATALAVGMAEIYSEFVGTEARARRRVRRAELRALVRDAAAVTFGAGFPAIFFVLSATGAIEVDLAFTLAKWTGLALICAYGFLAGRLAGSTTTEALAHAAVLGLIGGALIAVKAILH